MTLPDRLLAPWQHYQQRFLDTLADRPEGRELLAWFEGICQTPEKLFEIQQAWCGSDFIATSCITHPERFHELYNSGDLTTCYSEQQLSQRLGILLKNTSDDATLMQQLRRFRHRELLRIIWRDLVGRTELEETTRDMTWLAEAVIQQSLVALYPRAYRDWGRPVNSQGELQQLVVLGMGKLGARELNVSSDIDLIFAYPEQGQTVEGKRQLSNQEFFIKLSQKLIKVLDERTADGLVFRVDMRLRPLGQSGGLALSFAAMEDYYQNQGRDWERYAMIKARVIAGEASAGDKLMALLRPFTYRKYIDYSAIQALRDMKALINSEISRRTIADDIKKGAGGIREVEFIAQAFQIIRGGRDRRFQQPPLINILPLLEEQQLLPQGYGQQLYQAYRFLRNVEHRLQGWQDRQTQQLPSDEASQFRLAWLMGFDDWQSFAANLAQHRAFIHSVFNEIVAEQPPQQMAEPQTVAQLPAEIWLTISTSGEVANDAFHGDLINAGYQQPEQLCDSLSQLRHNRAVAAMSADSRARLDSFMPLLLNACSQAEQPDRVLSRILTLVESVVRRTAYLLMLIENPAALTRLVMLCDASPWVADQLARHPALLDELLDPRSLLSLPQRAALEDELRQQLLRIPEDDLEAQMDALRYFRMSHGLRVAACEISGVLPLMEVSDYLTWLAEAILAQVLAIAWNHMVERYGEPGGDPTPGMVIIGYGKLGGIELAHGSDLDLVFIHNAQQNLSTTGERAVDNTTFFTRLGQRVIHLLNAQTATGKVYEVDMRLRPSGNSGLLVTSMQSFAKYQQHEAWTWEHQALVRARAVAGDQSLARQFEALRHEILCRQRDVPQLQGEVRDMRAKMRQHLANNSAGETGLFHLKQDRGGIVDIEFMVQFAVLAWSHKFPQLTRWSDNVRILESLEASGLLSAEQSLLLTRAYKDYRAAGHRLQLQQHSSLVSAEPFTQRRHDVEAQWLRYLQRY